MKKKLLFCLFIIKFNTWEPLPDKEILKSANVFAWVHVYVW